MDGYKKALDKVINPSKHLNRNAKEASIVSRFFNFAKERLLNSNVRGILSDYRYIAQELINEKRFDIARKINNELLAIYNQLFTGYKSIKGEQNVQDLEASYNFFVSTSFLNLNNIKKCLEQLDDLEYSSCIEGLFLLELEKWYKEDSLFSPIIDNLFLTLDNTAHGLERGGEYDKALEIYCKVLEKRKKLLEPTDNLLLNNQYNIGTVLVNKAKSTKDTGEAVAYCDKMIEQAPDHYKKNFKDLKEEVLGKAQDSSSPKNKKNKLPNISNKIKKILDVDFIAALSNYREVLKYSEINKPGIAHQVGKRLLELYSQILVTYNKLKEAKGQGYPLYGPIVDGFPLIMGDAGEIFRNHERENQIWELKWQKSASKANSKKRERTTDSLEQESLSKKSNTEEQATDFPNTSTTDSVTTASTVSFANTSQSESQLPGKTDDKPRTCLNDPTADKQLQRSL